MLNDLERREPDPKAPLTYASYLHLEEVLNDYARTDDPFAKLGREQVSVDVSSVIRASPDSFRVAWSERHYKDGALAETQRWSAIVTVTLQVPHDPDRLRRNPLGIYVTALNWSKELG